LAIIDQSSEAYWIGPSSDHWRGVCSREFWGTLS
jgi:hypothetical protein